MVAEALVTDPALLSALSAAATAREQSLAILDLIEQYHKSPSSESPLDQQIALSRQQKILNTNLAQLRGLNRKAVHNVRRTKQETAEARQEIDSLHLQLQNLYYEQRHLRGEITACEDYQHKYQRLPMISQEDFLEQHPEHRDNSEHDLTIARIRNEHVARQTLEEQRQGLQKRKEALIKESNTKKDELTKLDADIEKWLSGEANIRKVFEIREKKLQALS